VAVERRLRPATSIPGTIQLTADLRSSGWQSWCQGCTALLHLAGSFDEEPGDERGSPHPDFVLARNLATACSELGIARTVLLSALGAGAQSPTRFQRGKWQAEESFRVAGLQWTTVRIPPLFGSGDHWTQRLTTALERLPLFPVSGDGSSRIQPLAVDELAGYLVDVLEDPDSFGRTLEAGGPEVITYRELLRRTAYAVKTSFRPVWLSRSAARLLLPLAARIARTPLNRGPLALLHLGGFVSREEEGAAFRGTQRYQGPTWLNDDVSLTLPG